MSDKKTPYATALHISRIYEKDQTLHRIHEGGLVNERDSSLDEISVPRNDPQGELAETEGNFLGEIEVGVKSKKK